MREQLRPDPDDERKKMLTTADERILEIMNAMKLSPEEDAFAYELAVGMAQHLMDAFARRSKAIPSLRMEAIPAACAYGLIVTDEMVRHRRKTGE